MSPPGSGRSSDDRPSACLVTTESNVRWSVSGDASEGQFAGDRVCTHEQNAYDISRREPVFIDIHHDCGSSDLNPRSCIASAHDNRIEGFTDAFGQDRRFTVVDHLAVAGRERTNV